MDSLTKDEQRAVKRDVGNRGCALCRHPQIDEIHDRLLSGEPVAYVAERGRFDPYFARQTLTRHISHCLKTSAMGLREQMRIRSAVDVEERFQVLLNEAEDALYAAKKVLMVDGDICFDPRAWEINVVYLDTHDRDERTNNPKLKSASLAKLLAKIGEGGYEPQHSYIKSEDMRKSYREAIAQIESLVDRFARLTGAYKREGVNVNDEIETLRQTIQRAATAQGWAYGEAVRYFLADRGHTLRPDLRGMLEKESLDTSTPLPAPTEDVKALPVPTTFYPSNFGKKERQDISVPFYPAGSEQTDPPG